MSLDLSWCLPNNFPWVCLEQFFHVFWVNCPYCPCFEHFVLYMPCSAMNFPKFSAAPKSRLCFYDNTYVCTDNGQIWGPFQNEWFTRFRLQKLQINPDFSIIGLSILQSLELRIGKLLCFLPVLLGDLVSSMNRVNSNPAGRVSSLVLRELTCPGWNSRELIEVFCSIQSRLVKQLNFPPNSVFYCTFDARFL